MAGLIRRGMAGFGAATEKAGLMAMEAALAERKAARLAELQARYQTAAQERGFKFAEQQQQRGFEHADTLQQNQQAFQTGQQQARFGQEDQMLRARQQFEREQREGRAIWWDKDVDPDLYKRFRQSTLPQPAYVYQPKAK